MGQAPATDTISLRTVPRNFPGRSGTREDKVCLVSPETAAASALKGVITNPSTLGIAYPRVSEPDNIIINTEMLLPPLRLEDAHKVKIVKGPNIASLPDLTPPPDALELPILLKLGDNISTDTISPAGARFRSAATLRRSQNSRMTSSMGPTTIALWQPGLRAGTQS
jgi:aconitate hydratase